jgi:hypothetical protein
MSSAFGEPPESGVIGLAGAGPEKIAKPSTASAVEAEATRRIGCGEGVKECVDQSTWNEETQSRHPRRRTVSRLL